MSVGCLVAEHLANVAERSEYGVKCTYDKKLLSAWLFPDCADPYCKSDADVCDQISAAEGGEGGTGVIDCSYISVNYVPTVTSCTVFTITQ